jgi:hypothetical protein
MDGNDGLGGLIAGGLGGGLIGYLLGITKYKNWEQLVNDFNNRLGHLSYAKITIPYSYFKNVTNSKEVYNEGVYAYLYGLPNASLPLLLKCLELGLEDKYKEIEKKEPPKDWSLYNIIEWSEKILKERKDLVHGFRILRNLIHTKELIREQDALESIRHISIILNSLFPPPDTIHLDVFCGYCNTTHPYQIKTEIYYIGNNVLFSCNKSMQNMNIIIMP